MKYSCETSTRLMAELPKTLEESIAQASVATKAAIEAGYSRLQVDFVYPEIALQAQSIAEQFIPAFEEFGSGLKVLFPDAGAAALARRDWGEIPFKIQDIGIGRTPIEDKIQPEDQVFLLVGPSAVELAQVEKLCQIADSRPVILLNPRLEDIGTIGIGYAGRQIRDRFLKTFESSYYLRPLEGAAIYRCYPSRWQVWLENSEDYQLIAEEPQRPVSDRLDEILGKVTDNGETPKPKKQGLFASMQQFLRALSR